MVDKNVLRKAYNEEKVLTKEEMKHLASLKKDYRKHRKLYEKKRKKFGDAWDYGSDEDYWRMRELGYDLFEFGQEKKIWVWDDVYKSM